MCNTLQIKPKDAIKAFNQAGTEGKAILTSLFGKDVFNQVITDRIKTFEDVLAEIGIAHDDFKEVCGTSPDNVAYEKLKLISEVLNEGWKPNWTDNSEYKYWPWFDMEDGFSFYVVADSCQYSFVGSRLCFKSSALAKYAAEQFLFIYKTYFVIPE